MIGGLSWSASVQARVCGRFIPSIAEYFFRPSDRASMFSTLVASGICNFDCIAPASVNRTAFSNGQSFL
jgi:hypothetical protein